jgi:type III restriction enzyme
MNQISNYIKNRLSLRQPQTDSLNILVNITDKLKLISPPINDGGVDTDFIQSELQKVNQLYPTCTSFEREFPSLCFALATGVGKTRLMGAFITYLYLKKGIKNFFVIAPNLTIYDKLTSDLGDPSNPKYVFKGIAEFVTNTPKIITGENYKYFSGGLFKDESIHINIFNISKINAETRGGSVPKIKRLSEYLGESYFNYLSRLNDLTVLMDESHHYRADRGMQVINELNPILGLELTATPQVESGNKQIPFKNVVYEYSLAKAIKDGFVKQPAVATRKDLDPTKISISDLERMKLEDGIRIHEDTKIALDIYARDNNQKHVKPFVLVVAKDTNHASNLKTLISSQSFFNGYYADKTIVVTSNQSGEEKEENIKQLVSLEDQNNRIEIVIHVYMLKEGWDVTNLYTIIPLNAAGSKTLIEQTIGRGLRLPYGQQTGLEKVDRLTIVAHDKFQNIVDEANKPDSLIRKENIIEIDTNLIEEKEIITSIPNTESLFINETESIKDIENNEDKNKAINEISAKKQLVDEIYKLSNKVTSISDFNSDQLKVIVIQNVKNKIEQNPQMQMFTDDILDNIEKSYEDIISRLTKNIIEIPRISLQQSNNIMSGFNDFDLDVKNINLRPLSEEILVQELGNNYQTTIVGGGRIIPDTYPNLIVNELLNYSEIDYDSCRELLFKLASQVIEKLKLINENESDLANVIIYRRKEIAQAIKSQMMEPGHFFIEAPEYEEPIILPFTELKEHHFEKNKSDDVFDFRISIEPISSIPSKVFSGFSKSCHKFYKFKSKTEKDFSIILENDKEVAKWLIPAQNQFQIYYHNNENRYIPDFIAETKDKIYMIETKSAAEMESVMVEEKAKAALEYCKYASKYSKENNKKEWVYLLIPHTTVKTNISFEWFVENCAYKDSSN